MTNPNTVQGYSRTGVPIMNHIDLVEPVTGGSDLLCIGGGDERPRGRRLTRADLRLVEDE